MTKLDLDELERLHKEVRRPIDDPLSPQDVRLIAAMCNALPSLIAAAREAERLRYLQVPIEQERQTQYRYGYRDGVKAAEARAKELEAENSRLTKFVEGIAAMIQFVREVK